MKKVIFLAVLSSFILTSCATRVVHTQPANTKVVLVKEAPRNHKVVVVKGKRYYKWNGKHYRKTRRGYVVVTL